MNEKLNKKLLILVAFTLLISTSISCPNNCLYCQVNTTCITCATNYSLTVSGNSCISKTIPNCRIYNTSQSCAVCQPTYQISSGQCIKDYSGCLIRNQNGKCEQCFLGTSLDLNGNCLGVINCATPSKTCPSCAAGYILENNVCKYNKSDCSNVLSNGLCGACNTDYVLNGFQCVSQASNAISDNSNFIQFCSLYSQNSASCLLCQQGYSLFQNICQSIGYVTNQTIDQANQKIRQNNAQPFISTPSEYFTYDKQSYSLSPGKDVLDASVTNIDKIIFTGVGNQQFCLLKQANSTVCQSCIDGYHLSSGVCIKTTPTCLDVNLTNFRCLSCNQNFALINGDCIDLNCNISEYSTCNSCKSGFTKTPQGFCKDPNCAQIMNGSCVRCNSNYLFSTSKGICVPVISNCITYNADNTLCTKCQSGYNLTANGICVSTDSRCLTFNASNCSLCKPQFATINGLCFDLNCQILSTPSICATCNTGYIINPQGYCYDLNCANLANGSCVTCNANYKLSNGFCVKNINNCTSYSTNGTCTNCSSVYALVQGLCVDVQCINQQYVNNFYVCINCKPGFNISTSGVCYDQNCYVSSNGSCIRCADNYIINSNGLCLQIDVGCLNFDPINRKCLVCLLNYTLNSTGQCTSKVIVIPSQVDNTTALTIDNITSSSDANCLQRNNQTNVCTNCASRYYIINGLCVAVPKQCQTYNVQTGKCISCITGYALYQQGIKTPTCVQKPNITDLNCLASDLNSFCIRCKTGYYITNGICYLADTMCKTFNLTGGDCTTCYDGYVLQQAKCVPLTQQANCKTFDYQNVCILCVDRFYLSNGVCLAVNSLCATYQPVNGMCLSCVAGYSLSNSACVKVQQVTANCQISNNIGVCTECINRYYLTNGACVAVNTLCQTYNSTNGLCLSCYSGYSINSQGLCVLSTSDLNCLQTNGNGDCIQCATNYFISSGKCLAKNPLCMSYDSTTGLCVKCVSLYYLSSTSQCLPQSVKSQKDPNCLVADLNNYCLQCPSGYFINQGDCQKANPLCKTYDVNSGNCTSCYDGYQVSSNTCSSITQVIVQDPNCQLFSGALCIQCNSRYYLNSTGSKLLCSPVNSFCNQYDMLTGNCQSCNYGATINGTSCISGSTNSNSNYYVQNSSINCSLYDVVNQTCLTCYNGFYYNVNTKACVIGNANCKTSNSSNGLCLTCFDGYQLGGGNCVLASSVINNVGSNVYCTQFNGTACVKCMNRYYVKDNTCYSIDPNCLTYNATTGYCLTCYSGYSVSSLGNCFLPNSNTISDPYCTSVINSKCINCLNGWYVDQLTGHCTLMSILCVNYDMLTGHCNQCASGSVLQDGVCFTPALGVDQYCALYSGVYCSGCISGYKLVSFVCQKTQ